MMTREEAVKVAISWKGTPYALRARVKGGGCDCGTLLAEYLLEIGATEQEYFKDLPSYNHDWFCNTSENKYLMKFAQTGLKVAEGICRGAVKEAKPGDIILVKTMRKIQIFNHGAIVVSWPKVIHAVKSSGVVEVDATRDVLTTFKAFVVFSPWGGK